MAGFTIPLDENLRLLVPIVVEATDSVKAMLRKGGHPVPEPVEATALIDTGATAVCLDETLVRQLDLPTRSPRKKRVMTATGSQFSGDYFAQRYFKERSDIRAHYVRVSAIRFRDLPFHALIGMNALMKWGWRFVPGPKPELIVEPGGAP